MRPGLAPLPDKPALGALGERINTNTIAIVSGDINAVWLTIAYDLSAVLDNGDDFRVLPITGRGGEQNVRDVRDLKSVDLGITVTPVLTTFRRTGELGDIDDNIVYITKLFNQEMHVLVRAEPGITSLEQLRGKTVNFSDVGSATQQSAREVFKRLNIEVDFDRFLLARPASAAPNDMTPVDRERLFQDFVNWSQANNRR